MSVTLPTVPTSGGNAAPEASKPAAAAPVAAEEDADVVKIPLEGFITGLIGAATIAVWFLILDIIQKRPLYTPTVLGTFLFKGKGALSSPETLSISFELVMLYTWVHVLIFVVIGGVASRLMRLAARNPEYGFGLILMLVVFLCGFQAVCMVAAEDVLRALAWPAVFVGNLLAAGAMGAYLWKKHPNFTFLM